MRRLIASFGYAMSGLVFLVRSQRNARLHILAATAIIGAGLYVGLERGDWLWILAAIAGVWSAEAINTALETLCDTLHPERAEGIRRVKDIAAGAVLIAAVGALIIGALVFWPFLFG